MINRNYVIIFALFFITIQCKSNSIVQIRDTVQVVLLAGQSNMAGAGNYEDLNEVTKKRIEKVSNRVSLSFNGKKTQPLSYYKNKPSKKYKFLKRFGPELMLGVTLAERNPNQEFLLIKRSQGGTSLHGAWNPNWTAEKAKMMEKGKRKQNLKLYELHIADIKRNLKQLEEKNKAYKIIGLFWMQGENDAVSEESAKKYKNNLRVLVNSYRKEFNERELPFVFGQINSRYGVKGGADLVRKNMENFEYQDYYSKLIKTTKDTSWSDFPKWDDNVHYNAEGQKRLGSAFGNAFFEILAKNKVEEFKGIHQLKSKETLKFKAKGETNMMYHVYTPSKFKPNKKLPIVIAFSPQGRGNSILYKMKESAEKMGWILVGVDKLKNGMKDKKWEKKMEDEVLDAIFKNIPHNKNQIYLAGFSGGAMRSYQLTTRRKEKFAGIIAYGGWLGGNDYQNKDYQDNLVVAMVNGLKDKGANKWNEKDAKTLQKHNATVKMFRHSGGHKVAPKEVTEEVFIWLKNQSKK